MIPMTQLEGTAGKLLFLARPIANASYRLVAPSNSEYSVLERASSEYSLFERIRYWSRTQLRTRVQVRTGLESTSPGVPRAGS